jgi:hypothetical protein
MPTGGGNCDETALFAFPEWERSAQAIPSRRGNMNQHVSLDAGLATSAPPSKGDAHVLALCSFTLLAAVLASAALILDSSLTAEQRIQVFQQSGMYP